MRFASVGVPGLCKNTLTIGATQHDALAHVDLLRAVNPLGAGRSCRRIVMGYFNNSNMDTCSLAATGRSCYELAYEAPRDARAAFADLALCCGCSLGDVLAGAPADAASQQSVYLALVTAYSSRVLASFSSRGPTVDGRQKPDVTAPGVEISSARSGSSLDAPPRPLGTFVCAEGAPTTTAALAGSPVPVAPLVVTSGVNFVLVTLEPTFFETVTLSVSNVSTSSIGLSLNGILPPLWASVNVSTTSVSWRLQMGVGLSSRNALRMRWVPAASGGSFVVMANASAAATPTGSVATLPGAAACWGMHSGNVDATLVSRRNTGAEAVHTFLVPLSGTSMATPAAAGTAILARQFFTDGWWPGGAGPGTGTSFHPSAALLKAVLVNGASPLLMRALSNTTYGGADIYSQKSQFVWSSTHAQEGWGSINLVRSLGFASLGGLSAKAASLPTLLLPGLTFAAAAAPRPEPAAVATKGVDPTVAHGNTFQACVDVASNGVEQVPLRITLAWSDPPGSTLSATALVNDLDLEVVTPDGLRLLRGGNDEAAVPQIIDSLNNVEKVAVRLPTPTIDLSSGRRLAPPYSVVVRGSHVPLGPQRFSLAVSGAGAALAAAGSCAPALAPGAFSPAQTSAPAAAIASGGGAEATIGLGAASGVWVASLVALGGALWMVWGRKVARFAAPAAAFGGGGTGSGGGGGASATMYEAASAGAERRSLL